MKSADLWKRHALATADRLHRPSVGRILVERQVTSGAMIIIQVGYQDPAKRKNFCGGWDFQKEQGCPTRWLDSPCGLKEG